MYKNTNIRLDNKKEKWDFYKTVAFMPQFSFCALFTNVLLFRLYKNPSFIVRMDPTVTKQKSLEII